MAVLILKDIVGSCRTNSDGIIVFNLIKDKVVSNKSVCISFKGISSVSSSFLNSAFIQLLEYTTFDNIRRCLKIIESNKHINESIIRRFSLEIDQKRANIA